MRDAAEHVAAGDVAVRAIGDADAALVSVALQGQERPSRQRPIQAEAGLAASEADRGALTPVSKRWLSRYRYLP